MRKSSDCKNRNEKLVSKIIIKNQFKELKKIFFKFFKILSIMTQTHPHTSLSTPPTLPYPHTYPPHTHKLTMTQTHPHIPPHNHPKHSHTHTHPHCYTYTPHTYTPHTYTCTHTPPTPTHTPHTHSWQRALQPPIMSILPPLFPCLLHRDLRVAEWVTLLRLLFGV